MAKLFSSDWAKAYMDAWNSDPDIIDTLSAAGFNSVVAFGYEGDDKPSFVMTIENGRIVTVAQQPGQKLNWDIRASKENWLALIVKPPGLMKLGIAYTSRKLRFLTGDYATMIKDPSLASAFVKSFALMGKVL